MIIKFIAETESEKKRFGGNEKVEHMAVKEYFIVGNKLDPDGTMVDFHEWNGSFRYLLGTLDYFYELINDDRRKALKTEDSEIQLPVKLQRGSGVTKIMPMVKRAEGGKIQPLDVRNLKFTPDTFEDGAVEANNDPEGPEEAIDNQKSLRINP